MRKIVALICILAILCVANTAFADTAVKKLGRGLANIIASPLEIGNGIHDAFEENGILAAATWGPLDGILRFGGRVLCGAYETATFVLPPYDPIITNPEFLCEGLFK